MAWGLRVRAVAGALALAACGLARAEGLDLRLEETFTTVDSRSTDQSGAVTRTESMQLLQRARAGFARAFFPRLVLDADGMYEWNLGWNRAGGPPTSDTDARRWGFGTRLTLGDQVLGGGVSYSHREEGSEQHLQGTTLRSPTLVREGYGAYVAWKPAELPTVEVRVNRSLQHDAARVLSDTVGDELQVSTTYRPARQLDLRYSVRWGESDDRLRGIQSTDVNQGASASWSDSFLEGRISAYAAYSLGSRTSRTIVTGAGGAVLTQVLPVAGLSAVEAAIDLPGRVRLVSNPRLVDGDIGAGDGGTASSAGLDLGTGPSAGGDTALRDMGAQFADLLHPVNTVHVWVNKPLPADVAAAILWTVWQSDDNQTWTQLGGAVAAPFGLFQPRFEIPIGAPAPVAARYLKVTARPLAVSATTDARYASILVTEVQFFLSESASAVAARGSPTVTGGQLSANGRAILLPSLNLAYDTALTWTHSDHPWASTWNVSNGLSASRKLGNLVNAGARVERSDSDAGRGRESAVRWAASASVDPLPTLGAGLGYSGQWSQRTTGEARSHSLTAFGRADLYQGISIFSTAGGSRGTNEAGDDSEGLNLSAGASLSPHRTLTLNGTYSRFRSTTTLAAGGTNREDRSTVEGSGSFSPFPALNVSGAVTRYISGQTPSTVASFNLGLSPFPGGQLVLRFLYSETIDTASDQRTRVWGPGARWNVRQGLTLDAGYTVNESRTPAQELVSKILFVNLNVSLL
ncbi:MAG: hypothetical protein HZB56_23230 [Deltaproteobacteria bacterium]|nr:hypothetical protein [Deltaproteobacteria bacterium]